MPRKAVWRTFFFSGKVLFSVFSSYNKFQVKEVTGNGRGGIKIITGHGAQLM